MASILLGAAALGSTLAGAIHGTINAYKNTPKQSTIEQEKFIRQAAEMTAANTLEQNAEDASKLSAQQGNLAGTVAQAQARNANMSRAAAAQIGANAASQNILNGYSQNFNTVSGLKQANINNALALGGKAREVAQDRYNSDKAKFNATTAATSSIYQSFADGLGGINKIVGTAPAKTDTNNSSNTATT